MLDEDEVEELVEDEELVDDEDETLPLDELVLDTLPLDDVLETLPLDEVLETLPLDVLLLDPPLEVLELDPPLDVEVEPPLEVEDTTMLPPLDPPPPKKPPAKNPPPNPPKPPLPPTTTGGEPPPMLITGCGGNGIGAPCEVTVTTCGWQVVVLVVTTRLRTLCATGRTACLVMWRLIDTRSAAWVSATCTAPPPMIAPPHAQAHNFAKAIRTDMIVFPVWTSRRVFVTRLRSSPDADKGRTKA